MTFGQAIRDRWWIDPEVAFLNHGSFGACPKVVLERQAALRLEMETQPVPFLLGEGWHVASEAIKAPARLLNLPSEELVFVDNATSGVNAVTRSFDLDPGDVVITTTHAYGAIRNTLLWVCQRAGATLVEVAVPFPVEGPEQVVEALRAALEAHPRAKLAVLDHVTSKTGLILPIEEMIGLCKRFEVPVLVDGAHVPGHFPVDVGALDADWYTGNLHKWAFAPKGCAVLHVSERVQSQTRALVISHGWNRGSLHEEFHWQGTKDPTAWRCAPDAIRFLEELGPDAVWRHNRHLAHTAADMLAEAWGTARPAPVEMCGAMVTLQPPVDLPATDEAADALHDALWHRHRVEVPCFPFGDRVWLRISAQVYNDWQEYERLAQALLRDGVR